MRYAAVVDVRREYAEGHTGPQVQGSARKRASQSKQVPSNSKPTPPRKLTEPHAFEPRLFVYLSTRFAQHPAPLTYPRCRAMINLTKTKSARLPANRAGSIAAASVIAFFLFIALASQLLSPSTATKHYFSSSTLFRKAPPSAWFGEGGYLRRNTTDGYATTYELRDVGKKEYTCDEYEISELGVGKCTSTPRLVKALRDNSIAQVAAATGAQLQVEGGNTAGIVEGVDEEIEPVEAELRRTAEILRGVKGKRVLYLGDSIDRYPLEELPLAAPSSSLVVLDPANGHILRRDDPPAGPTRGWTTTFFNIRLANSISSSHANDTTYHPSRRMHPDDFRIDFLFTFGLYHFPNLDDLTERIDLMDPIVGSEAPAEYDLICVNSGLWDMEAMVYPATPDRGITSEWIDRFVDRYIALIGFLRTKYGAHIPLAIRLTHDTHHNYDAQHFKPLRSEHIRQAQREVARRTGVRLLPFGQLMASQPGFFHWDGIHPTPEANLVHMETVLRMVQES